MENKVQEVLHDVLAFPRVAGHDNAMSLHCIPFTSLWRGRGGGEGEEVGRERRWGGRGGGEGEEVGSERWCGGRGGGEGDA